MPWYTIRYLIEAENICQAMEDAEARLKEMAVSADVLDHRYDRAIRIKDENGVIVHEEIRWLPYDLTLTCSLCDRPVSVNSAHLHQGKWIGDECCWDERLRSSE